MALEVIDLYIGTPFENQTAMFAACVLVDGFGVVHWDASADVMHKSNHVNARVTFLRLPIVVMQVIEPYTSVT